MTAQHDLKDLFRYATAHEPPPAAGAGEVFARADGLRRRQRVTAGLAGVAAAGALVSGFVMTWPDAAAPPIAPAPTATARIGATRVMDELRRLLHAETRFASEESRPGLARVVVADLRGRTTLEVRVDPRFTTHQPITWYDCATRTDPPTTTCDSTVLADGTRVVSLDQPGMNGVYERQVDTLGPTGLRVLVTAWNSLDTRHGPATRSAPAYEVADLREIATADVWHRVS